MGTVCMLSLSINRWKQFLERSCASYSPSKNILCPATLAIHTLPVCTMAAIGNGLLHPRFKPQRPSGPKCAGCSHGEFRTDTFMRQSSLRVASQLTMTVLRRSTSTLAGGSLTRPQDQIYMVCSDLYTPYLLSPRCSLASHFYVSGSRLWHVGSM